MKKRFFSSRLLTIGGIVLMVCLFAACKKSNDYNNNNTPIAGLMAFNLAVDKPFVGITLSGNNLTPSPLAYTSYTGAYQNIYTGTRTIQAYDNSSTVFATDSASFETGKYYSLFVTGAKGVYKNLVVNDNFDSLASASGKAYIRYINAIPDSSKPAITVTVGGNSVVNDHAGFSSVSGFVPVTAGDVAIAVNNEGTVQVNRTITLQENKIYTVLLLGSPDQTDSMLKPQIRFIENGSL